MVREPAPANSDPSTAEPASTPTASQVVSAPLRRGPGTYDRNQTTEQRRDLQRRQLLDAAAHVFARDGFAKASVAQILETSALSRGTFYRHFRDLRDAFAAVQEDAARVLVERIEAAFQSRSEPPEQMRAAITAYLELLREHADLARVFHREARISGAEHARLRRDNIERIVALFKRGLEAALERGLVRHMPDELTLYALVTAIEGVGMRYLEERREHEAVEAAAVLERLCFKAIE
jgi:AcrR family transcriptional regulator